MLLRQTPLALLLSSPALTQMAEPMAPADPVPFTLTFAATDGATPA